jgi:hypothetical protein
MEALNKSPAATCSEVPYIIAGAHDADGPSAG